MKRPERTNVTRVRRPFTWKRVVRGVLFAVGLVAGFGLSWVITPHSDALQVGVSEARGLLFGAVFGLLLIQLVREPSSKPGSRLPDGFGSSLDQLRETVSHDPSDAGDRSFPS